MLFTLFSYQGSTLVAYLVDPPISMSHFGESHLCKWVSLVVNVMVNISVFFGGGLSPFFYILRTLAFQQKEKKLNFILFSF